MTFATVNERVENNRTSPDWCCEVEGGVDVEGAGWVDDGKGDEGEGTGDGYAR